MKTILLVEDSRFMRLMNERALVKAGYTVVTTEDGEKVVRLAVEKTPQLIILDMLLPNLSGQQVLQLLRKNSVTQGIPVGVLSSLPQSNERRLIKKSAVAYYDKSKLGLPHEADSLVQIVRNILRDDSPEQADSAGESEEKLIRSAKGGA